LEELQKMSIPGLDAWLQSPQGRYVMAWEQATDRQAVVADLFGYNAIQLGLPQFDLLLRTASPCARWSHDSGKVDVLCDLRQLPFAAHSIDLVVMAHSLEFHDDPHQILREVERVLIPEGELIIAGFNPISIWGLRAGYPTARNDFPWNGHYLSVPRLKDWLQLLGFEVERGSFGCYAPPFRMNAGCKRWHFLEASGERWWTFAGGVYVLRAIKRVHSMRLILPSWKQQAAPRKALSVLSKKEIARHER
jgi:SAM-dependent methyltransferase